MAKKSKSPRKPKGKEVDKPYVLTDEEKALEERHLENDKKIKARIKITDGKTAHYDHDDQFIGQLATMEAVGSTDIDFLSPFINQLIQAAALESEPSENNANFILSVIKGIKPRDQVEAMLAAQMATVHMVTMNFARRLQHAQTTRQQDSADRAFNKLARTYISQMEALRKYRTGGQQKVIVEHVHVHEGGQAVVGNINHNPDTREGGVSGK